MTVLSEALALYVGDIPAQRAYLGDALVWEPTSVVEPSPGPEVVRSGRQANGLTLTVDVTGGRSVFLIGNQASNTITCDLPGAKEVARDNNARRATVWAIPEGATTVTFTAIASRLWGFIVVDWEALSGTGAFLASNATAEMPSATTANQQTSHMCALWVANNSADWWTTPDLMTPMEIVTTQNVEPSWILARTTEPAPVSWWWSPWMSRGKEGTARVESTLSVRMAPARPKLETFVETFDTAVDSLLWGGWGTYGWDAGRLKLTEESTASSYSGATTTAKFDLHESSIHWRMTSLQPPAASRETTFSVLVDDNNGIWTVILDNPELIFYRIKVAGVSIETTVAYNPVAHAWHRIRMAGTTVFWDTSPDAVKWTTQWSQTTALVARSCYLELSAGHWMTVAGATSSAYFDDINGPALDPDTQRFLDATELPDHYSSALDGLVRGIKDAGLWAKMTAVYPFIGGTADFHKWNLIDPRDTDDAFRLTYVEGTGSHSDELGYQPNAAYDSGGGYADTHLIPAGLLDPASVHLSAFSLAPLANGNRCDFGAYNWDGTTNRFHLIVHYMSGEFYYSLGHTGMNNTPAGDGSGLFTSSRTSMSEETAYLNGAAIASNQTAGGVLPPVPLFIGCLNGFIDEFSDMPFGFVSIGSGLDAQNVADLNTVVQRYRLAVSTAHWTPASIPGLAAWFDPAQDTYADGETITEYREHASGGRFVATAGGEPVFRTSPPRLEFPSAAQGLVSVDQFNLGPDGLTFVMVNQFADFSNYPMMLVSGPDTDGFEMRHSGSTMEMIQRYTTHSIANGHGTPDIAGVNNLHIMRVQSGVRCDAWVNDVLWQGPGAAAPNLPWTLYLGRRELGYPYRGTVAEALVYAGPISNEDLALLTDYLAQKHALYTASRRNT